MDRFRLREWSAIESFAQGRATAAYLRMLRELLGMCVSSLESGIGPEAETSCAEAGAILASFGVEHWPEAMLRMDAAQIAVMRELQGYHDLQRAATTWGQYLRIIESTLQRLGNAPAPAQPRP